MDDALEKLRAEIDSCDNQIAAMLQKRLAFVRQVAEVKKENSLPIFDSDREMEIVGRIEKITGDKDVSDLMKIIVSHCRNLMLE